LSAISFVKPIPFPPGVTNANWYSFYNAVSFQIFLGSPMVLYAKHLGASATLLGFIAALTPLLVVFQIPAAKYFPRYGYRRFILAGWGTRNLCVFAAVAVPLLGFLSDSWKLALMVACLFVFNLLRGITVGAWMPWLAEILPENIRPRFLSRDQRFMQIGSLTALLFCGLTLQKDSSPWEFSLVFLFSAIGGALSLYYLNHIPDVNKPEALKKSGASVPWLTIATYPPFAKLIGVNILLSFATGSLSVFTVTFLKGPVGMGANYILYLLALGFVAGVTLLGWAGRRLEKIGSKRLLGEGISLYMLTIAGWTLLALGAVAPGLAWLLPIFVVSGVAGAMTGLANSHLLMGILPQMGRSHFSAFYSVVTSLALGATPIFWGAFLDALAPLHRPMPGGLEWNHFSVYFTLLLVLAAATYAMVCRVSLKPEQPDFETTGLKRLSVPKAEGSPQRP
jgi:MFS family permease